ncbi:hypothetical protein GLOIN_2v1775922 [Rhizophagus irregularis DAOM 181602=DAOM 197198]|uniref:Uncharacterized protein n=1 Tax=Rhizophagus irregularis (strain DAOM 181602 / DAOM 197198 / MUCL 43194) TaxID=747089 RepID=A0A2P4PYI3_RHIID|nr:hypothetical protein GLOIN_2v1775922 [Rhizophagus irregularis DAOM 181602=DAOM 197198]POG70451.1 hypothetical protein GLOIN_2v1775922 [Rhizophagus irregularis DAOM 181602=DAOM 197198]|eukprot:XP_025177317.1 hypothetical protein GLOIN_2v1775922 [Rhizophagus irregularis DAOM 181602=DAOM 197198]
MISNIHTFTPAGKIKRPSYSTVATWVKESWDEVDENLIQRSFKSCGVSTNIDGSEDDCIFDHDSLLNRDNEVLENFDNSTDENYEEEYPEETNYENKWDVKVVVEVGRKEDNDKSESEKEEDDGNYDYQDSDDHGEMRYRLSELKKVYKSNEIPDDSSEEYILKVKLEYFQALHSQHTDYPLASERMKDEYVVHYRNLQYYISQSLVIKKVYEAIKFEQAPWMKPYIEFNTAKHAKTKNDFEKDFYELMNNSVFGKTMENLRKRVRVSVVQPQTHPKKYKKLTSDPAFKGHKIFSENLVAIYLRKVEVMLNCPTYVGMSVLDLSKLYTDSLLVQIQTEDINADLIYMADQFDFSDYPKDHPVRKVLGDKTDIIMKIPGKFKDECNGAVIAEFIGLRPKMYSILKVGDETTNLKYGIRKAKGVPSKVVKKEFHYEWYNKALFDPKYNDTVTFRAI